MFVSRKILVFVLLLVGSGNVSAATSAEAVAWKAAIVSFLSLVYVTNPLSADRMIFQTGGGEDVAIARIGAQWDWKKNVLTSHAFTLDTVLQVDYASWQSTRNLSQEGADNSLAFNPIFRLKRVINKRILYLDTSVGLALLSTTKINSSNLGSSFQFSGLLGIGLLVGARHQWGIGYKFNHISNNSIKLPNNGINFHLLSFSYEY